jgi:polycystin 1L2
LKHIIAHDLQTREKSYFLCEKWLAIDKDDGRIERVLPISRKPEMTSVKYLFSRRAKDNLNDDHLWFSIFSCPVQSPFTRLDRLTCCFVLLSISMLMNIMYYGMDNSPSEGGLTIGPYFNLTLNQLSIGIMTSLIVFIPSLLLVHLFRRIKRKNTRLTKLKKILKDSEKTSILTNVESPQKQKKTIFSLKFPWWFKIVAYLLSFTFTSVSLVFVIIKGIEFGDAQVTKWLTSLIISFLSSILFTQPLKVALMTCLFVLVCRKFENKNDIDGEGDDEMSLNKIETKNVKLISI